MLTLLDAGICSIVSHAPFKGVGANGTCVDGKGRNWIEHGASRLVRVRKSHEVDEERISPFVSPAAEVFYNAHCVFRLLVVGRQKDMVGGAVVQLISNVATVHVANLVCAPGPIYARHPFGTRALQPA